MGALVWFGPVLALGVNLGVLDYVQVSLNDGIWAYGDIKFVYIS